MKTETKLLIAVVILSALLGVMVGWQISAFFGASGVAAVAAATRRSARVGTEQSKDIVRSANSAADLIIDAASSINEDEINNTSGVREDVFDEDFAAQPRPGSGPVES